MPYHHGNLREALIDAAEGLARTGGPDEIVLRAVSRAADVSHNAAYRHFEDRDDLLRAVADRCMARLAALMEAGIAAGAAARRRVGPDPVESAWDRLAATGRAYIEFALTEPGWFRTAFSVLGQGLDLGPGGGRGPGGRTPHELLSDALDGLVAVGALDATHRAGAEFPTWSVVHGISTLMIDGPLRGLGEADRTKAIEKVLSVVRAGLPSG